MFGGEDQYTGPYGKSDEKKCTHSVVVSQKQVTFVMKQRGEKAEYKCTNCSKIFIDEPPKGSQVKMGFIPFFD